MGSRQRTRRRISGVQTKVNTTSSLKVGTFFVVITAAFSGIAVLASFAFVFIYREKDRDIQEDTASVSATSGVGDYPYGNTNQLLIQDRNSKHARSLAVDDKLFMVFLDEAFDAQGNETNAFMLRVFDDQLDVVKEVVISDANILYGTYDLYYHAAAKRVFLVWEEILNSDDTASNVYFRSFDVDGNTVQKKKQINQDNLELYDLAVDQHSAPRLTFGADNAGYVTWIGADEKSWNFCVYGQKIDIDGNPLGKNFRVAQCDADYISKSGADVAFARGSYMFVWTSSNEVYAQMLDDSLVPDGEMLESYSPLRVDDNEDSQRNSSVLTDDELFFVLYEDFRDYEYENGAIKGGLQVRMRPLYSSGTPVIPSLRIGQLLNLRGYESVYQKASLYTVLYGHENPSGSDDAEWQVQLLYTDLNSLETQKDFTQKFSKSSTNVRGAVAADAQDLYLTWKQDRPDAESTPGVHENYTDTYLKWYSTQEHNLTAECTEDDWEASGWNPASCPDDGTQKRTWSKTGECEGGVTHESSEQKTCFFSTAVTNEGMYNALRGKIILRAERNGEAYYIHPTQPFLYYLGRPDDAFRVMREQGFGISNDDLLKIAVGFGNTTGKDSDNDGLPDEFEDGFGTNRDAGDTDSDGFDDKTEIQYGYSPVAGGGVKLPLDSAYAAGHRGKIFLQVENNGEAWYVQVSDTKRYFLARPHDAFNIMRNFGLGISESDFGALF